MDLNQEIANLRRLTIPQLQAKYAEVFGGEGTNVKQKPWLIKRIAWRLQALAEGDLAERARRRAAELARDADLRLNPPPGVLAGGVTMTPLPREDKRLPIPGTVLTRPYKGGTVQVKVLENGFEYAGQVYTSLTAVAKAVTGSHCNGIAFFGLGRKGGDA